MKKAFGLQAEFNITADEDIIKGIGSGIKNGSVVIADIIKDVKPMIASEIRKRFQGRWTANQQQGREG